MDAAGEFWTLGVAVALFGLTVGALRLFGRQVAVEKDRSDQRAGRAMAMARKAVARTSTRKRPRRWVRPRMQLAMLLIEAGGRQHDRACFEEAMSILDTAIPVLEVERLTPELATALYYKGRAEWGLGLLEPGSEWLESAAATFRVLLDVKPWPRHLLRAVVLSLPAVVLVDLGDRKDDASKIEEGLRLAREAVMASRRRIRVECCITWRNLCHALAVAGRRAGDEAMLQEAVEAGRRAVELVDRSRHPEQWIASHSSLGHALGALGELKGDAAMLREAIGLLEAGISVTEAKLPREGRSMLLQNIGSVRLSLARETSDDAILAQAVEELRGAFAAFEAAGLPYPWAQTARLLGDAVSESGDLREAAALYRNAIDCFDKGGANSQAEGTRAALERLGDMHGNRPPASHIPIYQVK